MISEKEALKLETRKKIYKTILDNPGIHQRAIVKKLKISSTNLRYHLQRLVKYEIVIRKSEDGYVRYFASNKVDNKDKIILNILRQEVPRKILILMLVQKSYESLTKKQIKNTANPSMWKDKPIEYDLYKIKLNPTTINYHLQKLLKAGLIERLKEGRKVSYRIANEEKIIRLLVRYQDTFDDYYVNDTIHWFKSKLFEQRLKNTTDKVIDRWYEIFPHPYHM